MKDAETVIADVEAKWYGSTNEKREDMGKRLKKVEGALDESDSATRTRIGALIDEIEHARHHTDGPDFVVPQLSMGAGFGLGTTIPAKLDVPEQGR